MVTQHRHLAVGQVVRRHLAVHQVARLELPLARRQQPVQRDGGVEGAEHLHAQPIHLVLQEGVQVAGVQLAKQLVAALLGLLVLGIAKALLEQLHVVVDVPLHEHDVLVPDGVLAQEVKLDVQVVQELHVVRLEVAAADGVRLLRVVLLVAGAQRQPVDEVHRGAHLLGAVVLGLGQAGVLLADRVHVILQLARLLVLCDVGTGLEGAGGRQPHILELRLVDGVLPEGKPRDRVIVAHLLPALPGVHGGHLGHLGLGADVDGDVPRVHALLEAPHLGVLPAPAEQPRRLHAEVAHLLRHAIYQRCLVRFVGLLLLRLGFLPVLRSQLLPLLHLFLLLLQAVLRDGREVAILQL
mmetsp:Transcript_40222/g.101178  ORF Transcript_40222/g.101178 Transcript_40222/m.101178 type:complete len:353 (+) Transcript_40222:799-1857(+)